MLEISKGILQSFFSLFVKVQQIHRFIHSLKEKQLARQFRYNSWITWLVLLYVKTWVTLAPAMEVLNDGWFILRFVVLHYKDIVCSLALIIYLSNHISHLTCRIAVELRSIALDMDRVYLLSAIKPSYHFGTRFIVKGVSVLVHKGMVIVLLIIILLFSILLLLLFFLLLFKVLNFFLVAGWNHIFFIIVRILRLGIATHSLRHHTYRF